MCSIFYDPPSYTAASDHCDVGIEPYFMHVWAYSYLMNLFVELFMPLTYINSTLWAQFWIEKMWFQF